MREGRPHVGTTRVTVAIARKGEVPKTGKPGQSASDRSATGEAGRIALAAADGHGNRASCGRAERIRTRWAYGTGALPKAARAGTRPACRVALAGRARHFWPMAHPSTTSCRSVERSLAWPTKTVARASIAKQAPRPHPGPDCAHSAQRAYLPVTPESRGGENDRRLVPWSSRKPPPALKNGGSTGQPERCNRPKHIRGRSDEPVMVEARPNVRASSRKPHTSTGGGWSVLTWINHAARRSPRPGQWAFLVFGHRDDALSARNRAAPTCRSPADPSGSQTGQRQISSAYSRMVRSEENQAMRIALAAAIGLHRVGSAKTPSIARCACQ